MTAFTTISSGLLAAGKAVTTSLLTNLYNNGLSNKERLDAIDSSPSPVGANEMRNGSFETVVSGAPANWDAWSLYTGATAAIDTTSKLGGKNSLAFTTFSAANGGGIITSSEYIPVVGGSLHSAKATVSGISSASNCSCTATIASTVMTVTAVGSGVLAVGQGVTGTGVTAGTYISSLGTGTGGTGTYNLNNGSTVATGVTMTCVAKTVVITCSMAINWYDSAQSLISSSSVNTIPTLPTNGDWKVIGLCMAAPATARYKRIVLNGGIPSSSGLAGTIYFDNVVSSSDSAAAVITPGAIGLTTLANFTTGIIGNSLIEVLNYRVLIAGTYRVNWTTTNSSTNIISQVFRNGVPYSPYVVRGSGTYNDTADLFFNANDTLQFFAYSSNGTSPSTSSSITLTYDKTTSIFPSGNIVTQLTIGDR
jgi:hypothetical protein